MNLLKTDNQGYFKDQSSGVIINMNDDHYMQILAERERLKQHSNLCERMKDLESELSEIKSLLIQAIKKA